VDQAHLSQTFRNFAHIECKDSSKLYEYLSLNIAEDNELLDLCLHAKEGQPVPNLLFGAVHYLLLNGRDHVLSQYYPSVVANPLDVDGSFIHFKEFCRQYRREVTTILQSKLVQTNEVRRCAYLYPSFCYMFNKVKKPLALIEIGTSAGLQLLWDKYSYSYGTNEIYGDQHSILHITSEMRGVETPILLKEFPPVASKVGLDLHISDVRNKEDYLWLKSLIWPEHKERLEVFESAVICFKGNPVELLEGDGVALLTDVMKGVPDDTLIGIFHTHVANQIPEKSKRILIEKIQKMGENRDVFHLYNNMWDRKLHLDYFIDGVDYKEIIGEADGHGRWFEWNIK